MQIFIVTSWNNICGSSLLTGFAKFLKTLGMDTKIQNQSSRCNAKLIISISKRFCYSFLIASSHINNQSQSTKSSCLCTTLYRLDMFSLKSKDLFSTHFNNSNWSNSSFIDGSTTCSIILPSLPTIIKIFGTLADSNTPMILWSKSTKIYWRRKMPLDAYEQFKGGSKVAILTLVLSSSSKVGSYSSLCYQICQILTMRGKFWGRPAKR